MPGVFNSPCQSQDSPKCFLSTFLLLSSPCHSKCVCVSGGRHKGNVQQVVGESTACTATILNPAAVLRVRKGCDPAGLRARWGEPPSFRAPSRRIPFMRSQQKPHKHTSCCCCPPPIPSRRFHWPLWSFLKKKEAALTHCSQPPVSGAPPLRGRSRLSGLYFWWRFFFSSRGPLTSPKN